MINPSYELSAEERMVIAVDTSSEHEALRLLRTARESGAWIAKIGLELGTAIGWQDCAEVAQEAHMEWICDAKLKDIPNTVAKAVHNLIDLEHPPRAITVHTKSGIEALKAAQKVADERNVLLFGVTHLTSIDEAETLQYEGSLPSEVVAKEARRAVAGSIGGLVCSAQEVKMIKSTAFTSKLYTLIPGTRSAGADTHDQKRPRTPFEAIFDGADLLVIGRQVTEAKEPSTAFATVAKEIAEALDVRARLKIEEA